jgi:transposase
MSVKTVGLDLAKDVFQVHGISENGRVIFNKAIKRAKLLAFFETLPPCVVGMEACGSSHHWGAHFSQARPRCKVDASELREALRQTRQDRFCRCGLVTLAFRSLNSFRRPFVRMPRDFYHPAMSTAVVDYRTH